MKIMTLLAGLLVGLLGCTHPIILVGPRPGPYIPEIEYWYKLGTSAEQRVQDSIDCNGNEKGLPIESRANLEVAMMPGEEDTKLARRRLFHSLERCMLSKGYQYIGKCYLDDSVSSARPACGAP